MRLTGDSTEPDLVVAGEIFQEVPEHRLFLGEQAGHSFPFADTVRDYVDRVLANKPEEQSVLGARSGTPSDDTAEHQIITPTELGEST